MKSFLTATLGVQSQKNLERDGQQNGVCTLRRRRSVGGGIVCTHANWSGCPGCSLCKLESSA
ncbi:DUF2970 domain-containing protein [Marinobacter sp. LV10R520-4]|uniref:DUF2970 domain-containing protein n=1 Tax=unclassified Marinobacter TaxID=83889 RepID=UPI003A5CFB58